MKTSCKSLALIFLLIIFISDANAKYNKEQNNQRISIYLHPASLYMAYVVNNINIVDTGDADSTPIYVAYLTFEIPLSLSNSLIIQPSLWYVEGTWYYNKNEIVKVDKLLRLGSGIGFRHFVNGKGDGLYLQAMGNVNYYSIKELNENIYNNKDFYYKKGFYADLLGYLGYSWKYSFFSIFSDIGIGIIFPIDNPSYKAIVGGYKKPFTFDMNLGIGFSF
ncbi:MAG: hypothetical protein LBC87_10900 [Fibromonadaceae bacterium]|jgi:hypothetical protein|nr:hypothetical protein [Fibromonadaceae bacterium]